MINRIAYPCPCGGKIQWKKDKIVQDGIDCGVLDIGCCTKCGEEYLPEESMIVVEQKLKESGLWDLQRKEIKFWKSGKSVTIRLPIEIVRKLKLDTVKRGYVYQEGDHKIAIEY